MDYKTEKIKSEIERQYGSIRKFAEHSGIPSTTITSALKKGIGGTSVDTVMKICELLNINMTTLHSTWRQKEPRYAQDGDKIAQSGDFSIRDGKVSKYDDLDDDGKEKLEAFYQFLLQEQLKKQKN